MSAPSGRNSEQGTAQARENRDANSERGDLCAKRTLTPPLSNGSRLWKRNAEDGVPYGNFNVGRGLDPAEKPPLLGEGDRVSGGRVERV